MILAIDTSEKLTKISLLEDDLSVISEKEYTLNGELSERLLLEIDKLLKVIGKNKKDLSCILVNEGPGSYTGLRIGVTTANFLAFSLNIPVFGYKSVTAHCHSRLDLESRNYSDKSTLWIPDHKPQSGPFGAYSLPAGRQVRDDNIGSERLQKLNLNVDKFDSPILPFYNKPPHITKPILPS